MSKSCHPVKITCLRQRGYRNLSFISCLRSMDVFKVVSFESNNVADSACKELFSKSASKRNIKPSSTGKITKQAKKKRKIKNNKEKIKNVLQSNAVTIKNIKYKNQKGKKEKSATENSTQNFSSTKTIFKKIEQNSTTKQKRKISKNASEPHLKLDKPKIKKKKKKKTNTNDEIPLLDDKPVKLDYKQKKQQKFNEKLKNTISTSYSPIKEKPRTKSLRTRMLEKLQAARFRFINEQIYSSNSKEAQKLFSSDPETFQAYHEGYRQQVNKWPLNPLDVIIKSVQKMPKTHVIADFGCGDANLAKSVAQKVHSFDLVSTNDLVKACDMAHVPLQNNSVDVAVFCLSLMGTNLQDYILEANRVLKEGGILKIAEVESRFEDVQQFIEGVKRFHFKHIWKDLSHNLFYFLDFKKESNIKNKKKLPTISLNPCLYKKR